MTAAARTTVFSWAPNSPCDDSCVPGRDREPVVPRWLQLRRWAALAGVMALAAPVSLLYPLLSKGMRRRLTRSGARGILRAVGLRLIEDGPVAEVGPALVVGNHISWIDGLVLLAREPLDQVAKAEVRELPVFGALAARAGTVFITRERLSELPGVVAGLRDRLAAGATVAVFPEGTTRCAPEGIVVRPAMFQAALDAGVPVRPVRLEYRGPSGRSAAAAAFLGDEAVLDSLRRVVAARGLTVHLREGRTIWPHQVRDRREFARRARAEILGATTESEIGLRAAAGRPPGCAPRRAGVELSGAGTAR